MNENASVISSVLPYVYGILAISLALALFRLGRGPTLPDRVVALDLVASIVIGFIAIHSIDKGEAVFMTAAALLALVVFLGTIAFARYLRKRGEHD
jgi:multicomponent Na+:H+ antiporter subunit F